MNIETEQYNTADQYTSIKVYDPQGKWTTTIVLDLYDGSLFGHITKVDGKYQSPDNSK